MIFQTEGAIDKIISGAKTQTRRLVNPKCFLNIQGFLPEGVIYYAADQKLKSLYLVGHNYAVQPGRGKPGVWYAPHPNPIFDSIYANQYLAGLEPLRIRITAIRREDVRQITESDAKAEGYTDQDDFLATWASMHDKAWALKERMWITTDPALIRHQLWHEMNARPAERYQAWALTFEVVK